MSRELSLFTLTLFTLDGFIHVVFPSRAWQIRFPMPKWIITAIWTIAVAISVIPVLPLDYFGEKFYGRSGVCLPFQLTQGLPSGWEYYTAVFVILNALSCLAIFLGYGVMYLVVRRRHHATGATVDNQRMKEEMAIAQRMMLIVCMALFSWIPIIATGFLSAFSNANINGLVYAVMALLVLPVNSAMDTVFYIYSTVNLSDKHDSQFSEFVTRVCREQFRHTGRVSSLTRCLEEGWNFLPEHLMALSRDITAALTYLHQWKLRHGAVSPDNILIYKYNKMDHFRAYLAGTKSLAAMNDQDVPEMSDRDHKDLQIVMDMMAQKQEHSHG